MNEFLHPSTQQQAPLGYEWQGFESVIVFACGNSFGDVCRWYERDQADNLSSFFVSVSAEDDHAQIVIFDGPEKPTKETACDRIVASLLYIDSGSLDQRDELAAYLAEPVSLQNIVKGGQPTVGALFIHDRNNQDT